MWQQQQSCWHFTEMQYGLLSLQPELPHYPSSWRRQVVTNRKLFCFAAPIARHFYNCFPPDSPKPIEPVKSPSAEYNGEFRLRVESQEGLKGEKQEVPIPLWCHGYFMVGPPLRSLYVLSHSWFCGILWWRTRMTVPGIVCKMIVGLQRFWPTDAKLNNSNICFSTTG